MVEGPRIRVVVADDHPLVGEMLARIVEGTDGFELIAHCTDGDAALEVILERSPDVAVVDVGMPARTGPALANEVQRAGSPTRIVFLSGSDDPETLYRCVSSGGSGFVSKTAAKSRIVEAIDTVASGGTAFRPEAIAAATAGREIARARTLLSPQERRVLELSAEGWSSAEIARALYIGQTTVKTHLRHAADKLGVHGRAAAIAAALRLGIIG